MSKSGPVNVKQEPHPPLSGLSGETSKTKELKPLPFTTSAKPVASLLSIWTTELNAKSSTSHPDFKGRIVSQSKKAELYSFLKSSNK